MKRISYLFLAFAIGKWTNQTCSSMLGEFKKRIRYPKKGQRIEIFTDGNDDYTYALPRHFWTRRVNYAQLVKVRDANGKLIRKEVKVVYGDPEVDDVETVNVENFNSILRERVGRLVRRTKCFSKKKSRLWCALSVFQFYWDFMSQVRRGVTPAMLEDCSSRIWTWHDFYYSKLNNPI